ncbi:spore coat protein [Bacillus sp. CLL-7-23]|uniref:Spore coat protein n=1 Tax=Bacillus changyiensis TaxID=3004103 RepID=A0ABT4X1I1_9BACI|nr:spore coat protein [Bacillus changyiensis]MDA7026132.1 spore coat protein [Bacillus changyiensis]
MSFEQRAETLYEKMFNELSEEFDQLIEIIDSEHVTINTSNVTEALSLQAMVMTLIILAVQLVIEDQEAASLIAEDLLAVQKLQNKKRIAILVLSSRNVFITLSSTEIVISVLILTELLTVLLSALDII